MVFLFNNIFLIFKSLKCFLVIYETDIAFPQSGIKYILFKKVNIEFRVKFEFQILFTKLFVVMSYLS